MNQNENNEFIDSINDTDTTENEVEEEIELDFEEDEIDVDALRKENASLKAQKDHWKKKAGEKKDVVTEFKNNSDDNLSSSDLLAVMNAKVEPEDLSTVQRYAKFEGISIIEALKSNVVKTLLAQKKEERNVALATNTRGARPSSSKLSDEAIVNNANSGKLSDDVQALVNARFNQKRK